MQDPRSTQFCPANGEAWGDLMSLKLLKTFTVGERQAL